MVPGIGDYKLDCLDCERVIIFRFVPPAGTVEVAPGANP